MKANHQRFFGIIVLWLPLLAAGPPVAAQTKRPLSGPVTLDQAITFALQNYPAVRAAFEQVSAAQAGVGLARTSYLPHGDMLWQGNRATRNNIFGLLLPQSVIPSISGPVLQSRSGRGAWGSAAGLLFSWEPFDFGYRRATVSAARAVQNQATADAAVTRLEVAVATANAFLTLLAAQETKRADQADVDRRDALAQRIHVLVSNELRPGADASRANAELAAAKIRLIQAETQEEASRATLAAILGVAPADLKIDAGSLLEAPSATALAESPLTAHPLAAAEKARIDEAHARVHALDRSYYPHFDLETAVYGRGSGANNDGTFAGGGNGLTLDHYNWAAGRDVTFSVFDIAVIRARKQIEQANERREKARYDQTLQDLTGQVDRARAGLDGARRIAENTPVQLQAARDAELQARARYQAGETTIVEVADAQALLTQAEDDDAEAQRVEVEAKFAADEGTYERLKSASATPGVVAGNDLQVARKAVEADRARAQSARESAEAAGQALRSISEIEGYPQVEAPFDGIVTERNIHPGALVGPAGAPGVAIPMLRIEKIARLRLVVPVPEQYAGGISAGARVGFTVSASPARDSQEPSRASRTRWT